MSAARSPSRVAAPTAGRPRRGAAGSGAGTSPSDDAGSGNQAVKAQTQLREWIVGGELQPGERITELAMVERIGVSRTPIRTALLKLAQEGLLEALAGGGFGVRAFSEADIRDSITLRGTLEGLAARLAAERGAPPALWAQAEECVAEIDELLAAPQLSAAAFSGYVAGNGRWHALLAQMSGSELLQRQIDWVNAMPFAGPSAFVGAQTGNPQARLQLVLAQSQHRAVLQAVWAREGARAEALMREHAHLAQDNLSAVMASRHALARVPGATLIRGAMRRAGG